MVREGMIMDVHGLTWKIYYRGVRLCVNRRHTLPPYHFGNLHWACAHILRSLARS